MKMPPLLIHPCRSILSSLSSLTPPTSPSLLPHIPLSYYALVSITRFVDANKMREASKEKLTQVTVNHVTADGKVHRFRVIDRADHLTSREWNNVVAAFVTGQSWQFKMWKWKEPAELFHNIKGFYIKWADEAIRGEAQNWNVSHLNIHRSKRHTDRAVVQHFWDQLLGGEH